MTTRNHSFQTHALIQTEMVIQAATHPTDTPEQIQQRVAQALQISPQLVAQAMAQMQADKANVNTHHRPPSRGIFLIEAIGIIAAISIVLTATTLAITDEGPDVAARGLQAAQQWASGHRVMPVATTCDQDHDADGYARCVMKDQRLTYVLQCATGLTAARGCKVMDVQPNVKASVDQRTSITAPIDAVRQAPPEVPPAGLLLPRLPYRVLPHSTSMPTASAFSQS